MIDFHLSKNRSGQKRPRLDSDLRDLPTNKKIAKGWDLRDKLARKIPRGEKKKSGEKIMDGGNFSKGVGDQSSGKIINNYFYNNCGTITF